MQKETRGEGADGLEALLAFPKFVHGTAARAG